MSAFVGISYQKTKKWYETKTFYPKSAQLQFMNRGCLKTTLYCSSETAPFVSESYTKNESTYLLPV